MDVAVSSIIVNPHAGGSHAEGLLAALTYRRASDVASTSAADWAKAIDTLIGQGDLLSAQRGLRHLVETFRDTPYFARLLAIFDSIPRSGITSAFQDDAGRDVQIARRHGSNTVAFFFCGHAEKLGLPLNLMHQWTGRLNASVVYLRDFHRRHYLQGIKSIGATRADALIGLRLITAALGGRRIVCYGNSAGSFAALHYGLELGAENVVCWPVPPTVLEVSPSTWR